MTIFSAQKIITVDLSIPFATHVAVENGKIVEIGGEELLSKYPQAEHNTQFSQNYMIPGFVEGHAHLAAGQDGLAPYVGYFDRPSPSGGILKGLKSLNEVIAYLQEVDKKLPKDEPLMALGFDPIYFDGPNPTKIDLDKVSTDRVIILYHASGHLMTVNSKTISLVPQDKLDIEGIAKDQSGQPTGEFREMESMQIVFGLLGETFIKFMDPTVLFPRYVSLCKMAGVTTITEMGLSVDLDDPKVTDLLVKLTSSSAIRLVPMYFMPTSKKQPEEVPAYIESLKQKNTDKLYFGHLKMMSDGSIQGYTARVKEPYINGVQNGIWNEDPEFLKKCLKIFNAAGIQVNCHCNGDESSEAFIEAVSEALSENPRNDHRHTIQHGQMVYEDQFNKIKELGICINIFTNHIYYWGDQHVAKTIGLERATNMDGAGSAQRLGIPYSLHCDASVTPIAPLFNIWTAVNRLTASGRVLGEGEKITVEQGLYAMTMGTAYLLRLEDKIGSISVGKFADFAVLDQDILSCDPEKIKDIKVLKTVTGGIVN